MFALAPDAQLLVLQFVGAPTGAELMATSRAARPPPAAMYALHRVWMPRWEASMMVQRTRVDEQHREQVAALERHVVFLEDRVGAYSRRVMDLVEGRRA